MICRDWQSSERSSEVNDVEEMKKPAIRFEGFTEDWEKKPLSAFSNKVSEKNTNNQYTETFTNSAEFGVISQRDFFDHDISNAENINGYYIVKSDDFVYNPRISVTAPCGPINRNKLGRSGVMSPLYTVFRTNDVNKLFLEWYFKSDYWHSYMYFNGDSGARSDRFSIKNDLFFQMPIPVPSTEEQQQIGFALDEINDTITLHQQKYDKLLTFKKSMLEKLFPQNGAKVPEVRFAGFDGEWGFRKFGEVFEEYSEKNHDELPALTIIQGFGTVRRDESGRSIQYDESGLKGYKLVREGDFIVHLRSFEGGLEKSNSTGIVSPAYHMFHGEGTDTRFFYAYFRSKQFVDVQLKPHVYGIRDGRSIDIAGMKTILIPYPSLPEQQKIGDFLEKIDDLILSSQTELEKLKNIKSALLEKMFV